MLMVKIECIKSHPTGVLAQSDGSGWQWLLADAQGNTRMTANTAGALAAQTYSPYGQPLHPALQSAYATTGEPTDAANGLVYLRARHLSPRLGVFPSRDRFEGVTSRLLSLNPYAWVEGNVVRCAPQCGVVLVMGHLGFSSLRSQTRGDCAPRNPPNDTPASLVQAR
jgi:RHS repeat-associated protein